MRRRPAAALAIIPLLAIAALAGGASASAASVTVAGPAARARASVPARASASPFADARRPTDTRKLVTVTGPFGHTPKVKVPAKAGTGPLYIKTVIRGTGPRLTRARSLIGDYAVYDWSGKTHKLIGSTYVTGLPTLFAGSLLPGLKKALMDRKAGGRVLAVLPPAQAFGPHGNPSIGVGPTDTVVFVIDLLNSVGDTEGAAGQPVSCGGGALPTVTAGAPGQGPVIAIPPKKAAPKTLRVKTLIKGAGPKVTKGQFLVVQYTGVNWRTGKVFDSSWSGGQPFGTEIGVGQVIRGWDKGLVGQTVGSRVLLVIPPADGYGPAGVPSAGIKGTDTLVFAVDILFAASRPG